MRRLAMWAVMGSTLGLVLTVVMFGLWPHKGHGKGKRR